MYIDIRGSLVQIQSKRFFFIKTHELDKDQFKFYSFSN